LAGDVRFFSILSRRRKKTDKIVQFIDGVQFSPPLCWAISTEVNRINSFNESIRFVSPNAKKSKISNFGSQPDNLGKSCQMEYLIGMSNVSQKHPANPHSKFSQKKNNGHQSVSKQIKTTV
jgi:hypothetical protein